MRRDALHIVVGVVVAAGAGTPALRAQGGGQTLAPTHAPSVAPAAGPERPRLEPARAILRTLVGTWRFEVRLAGNYHGAPDASGTRVFTALFDDLRLEWAEELDHSPLRARGFLGFDPASNRFFSTAVSSGGGSPELLSGVLDDAGPVITFRPIPGAPGATPGDALVQSSELDLVTPDHFLWTALDRGWRAVFTRQP